MKTNCSISFSYFGHKACSKFCFVRLLFFLFHLNACTDWPLSSRYIIARKNELFSESCCMIAAFGSFLQVISSFGFVTCLYAVLFRFKWAIAKAVFCCLDSLSLKRVAIVRWHTFSHQALWSILVMQNGIYYRNIYFYQTAQHEKYEWFVVFSCRLILPDIMVSSSSKNHTTCSQAALFC